jgi:hypothetical protein
MPGCNAPEAFKIQYLRINSDKLRRTIFCRFSYPEPREAACVATMNTFPMQFCVDTVRFCVARGLCVQATSTYDLLRFSL